MNTITIDVNRYSNEWTELTSFVQSLGLTIRENGTDGDVRAGWAEEAKRMHECGDDRLIIDDVFADEVFE